MFKTLNNLYHKIFKKYKVRYDCQIYNLNQIYKKLFGYKNNGVFVEVGAYDGERWSNTSCLADIGWDGVYIEPVKEYYLKCVSRHKSNPKVEVLNLAIGEENKEIEIFVGEALSTILHSQVEFYKNSEFGNHQNFSSSEICNQVRLEDVLVNKKIPKRFDLLVVDTEGYEEQVFKSFDLSHWAPKVIIVELHDKNEDYKNFTEFVNSTMKLRSKILATGYKEVYSDEVNTIFAHKEYQNI